MKTALVALAIAGAAVSSATAQVTLAEWTFETSAPASIGPHTAEAGINAASSFARGSNVAAGTRTFSSPAGNGSLRSFSGNGWATGDFYEFTTNTLGYQSITLTWDQTRSNTGPADFAVRVSTDNFATFTTLVSAYTVLVNGAPNLSWGTTAGYQAVYTFAPVAAGAGADNQANVAFRLVANVGAASGGTNRVDNVKIQGTLIPAPGALALVGLGGLVAARRRRA